MISNKSILPLVHILWLAPYHTDAQSNFQWGLYTQMSQGNISEIYEWRNFLCFEGCSSVGHQPAFSYEVGLNGQWAISGKANFEVRMGYSRFNYIEEETWSDGANFFVRETKRELQHLTLGLGIQYEVLPLGNGQGQLYVFGGLQGMWNANQEIDFGLINYEGTIAAWNSLGELGLGLNWSFGKIQLQAGPHFRFALNNFGKSPEERNRNTTLDKLHPRELGIRLAVLFP